MEHKSNQDFSIWFLFFLLIAAIYAIWSCASAGADDGKEMTKIIGTHREYVSKQVFDQFVANDERGDFSKGTKQ